MGKFRGPKNRGGQPVVQEPLPPVLGDAPRDLVYRKLSRQCQHYPNLLIGELNDEAPSAAVLDPRDLAFAHAVYDGVISRWLTLEYIIQGALKQPIGDLEARLRAVLMAGAAQLIVLDKVPAYAAINHAVEWAKERIRPGAGSMVNAVLRQVARTRVESTDPAAKFAWGRDELPTADGGVIRLAADVLPEDESERVSIAASVPRVLVDAWRDRWGVPEMRRLALHTLADAPTILNTGHLEHPLTPAEQKLLKPHGVPGHHFFSGARTELVSLLASRRDLWVQDPASSATLSGIAGMKLDGGVIIDMCAGQGTKTRQLAAMFPGAQIIASDVDRRRHESLKKAFAGHARVKVVGANELKTEYIRRADLVLLDVPCSNTGVLARRPEAKYRFGRESLESLTGIQKQIIADAIPLLKDGMEDGRRGKILYSTCSLEVQENEQQPEWAEKWHTLRTERVWRRDPAGGVGMARETYADGSFAALMG